MRFNSKGRKHIVSASMFAVAGMLSSTTHAASGTWTQTATGGLWSDINNWSGGVVADGAGSVADFSTLNITADNTVHLDGPRSIQGLLFGDTTVATAASWVLDNNGSATNILTLDGTTPTITVNALGTGKTATVSAELAGILGLTKAGAGTLVLSGANTYTGTTQVGVGVLQLTAGGVINAGSANVSALAGTQLVVNGGTLTSSALSTIENAGSGFLLSSGSATFNAGIRSSNSDGSLIALTGGIFTATDVELRRTQSYGNGAAPSSAAATNNGLYVNGATANIGTLRVGTSNSSASARVDSGALNVSGQVSIGFNSGSARWCILQVNGGSFTSTDATNGIVLVGNTAVANRGQLLLSGGTTTIEKLTMGIAGSGNFGNLTVSGSGTNFYVGSGGLNTTPGTGTYTFNLNGGTMGAKADWASSVPLVLGGSFTLRAADAGAVARNIDLSGVISSTAGTTLTKSGAGTVTLSGNNSYALTTSINAGSLKLGSAGSGANSPLGTVTGGTSVSGTGTLDLNGFTLSTNEALSLNGTGTGGAGALSNSSATAATYNGLVTLAGNASIVADSGDITIANGGTITGPTFGLTLGGTSTGSVSSIIGTTSGSVTKAGTGTWTLNAINTYSGATNINQGTLKITQANSIGASSNIIVASGATLDATTSGLTIASTKTLSGDGSVTGTVTGASGSHLAAGGVGTISTTLNIADLSFDNGSFLDLDLSATSGISDRTTITNAFTLPSGGVVSVNLAGLGGAVPGNSYNIFNFGSISNFTPGSFNVVSGGTGGLTYTFGTSGNFVTLAISGAAAANVAWNQAGGGSWATATNWTPNTVPQNAGDTATFGTSITAPSIVTLDGNKSVGVLNFNNANSYTINQGSGGTLSLDNTTFIATVTDSNGSHTINVPVSLNAAGAAITVTNAPDTLTISGNIAGVASAITKSGSGTLVLSGNNTYSGGTTINSGVVAINSASSLGAVGGVATINAGTLQATTSITTARNFQVGSASSTIQVDGSGSTYQIDGIVSDGASAGSLTKSGTGTLVLNNANTYSGGTTISAGTISTGPTGTLSNGGSPSSIGQSANVAGNLVLNGTTLVYASTGGASTTDRLFTMTNNGATLDASGADTITFSNTGAIAFSGSGARTLTLTGNNAGYNFLNPVIGTGSGGATSVVKSGTGTWVLAGTNTYAGATTINSGSLILLNSTAFGTSAVNINSNNGILFGPGVTTATFSSLTGAGNFALSTIDSTATALTVGGNNATTTYSGAMSGNGSLTKTGTGTLILTGNNSYTGVTNLLSGPLQLDPGGVINGGVFFAAANTSAKLFVNGGSFTAAGNSTFTGISQSGGGSSLEVAAGTATFANVQTTVDGVLLKVNGGTLNAANLTLTRTSNTVSSASNSTGFYMTSGATNISNTLALGTSNSSASARIEGGTLTTLNMLVANQGSGGRGGVVAVTGGALNVTDTTSGLVLVKNNGAGTGQTANIFLSGGTTTLGKLSFGFDSAVASGSVATVNVSGTAGLYIGTGGIVKNATDANMTSTLNLNGGTLGADADWTTSHPITIGGAATIRAANAANTTPYNITLNGDMLAGVNPGSLTKSGAGTLTTSGTLSYTGSTTANAGKLVTMKAIQNGSALTATGGAIVEVPINGGSTAVTSIGLLTTTGTGSRVELHDNDLIINYGAGPNAYADTVLKVKSGLLSLGGTGTEGISSVQADGLTPGTSLAVVDNAVTALTSLSGFTIPNPTTSVLVKFTWLGDANLDGIVDGTDYALTDSGFAGGGTTWDQGDYNYSGGVDGTDYALIDTGFGSQSGTLPEPTALGLLGLGAMGMLRRRRRA